MYGHSAYKPCTKSICPCLNRVMPVANVRFPPPLSPEIIILPGSMAKASAWATSQCKPDTQSFSPAGKGATSGAEDGLTALRKSTMATATPFAAIMRPQA